MEGKHGWNAHDYSPESLADFFTLAGKTNFPLNPEEELLMNICLANGILKKEGEVFSPGRGAVISTSLSTFYEQRFIFMTHEAIHGLFFTQPEFRRLCEDFWPTLRAEEQHFWMNFLSYRGYNVAEDRDLLITEVTAYLLQQPPKRRMTILSASSLRGF